MASMRVLYFGVVALLLCHATAQVASQRAGSLGALLSNLRAAQGQQVYVKPAGEEGSSGAPAQDADVARSTPSLAPTPRPAAHQGSIAVQHSTSVAPSSGTKNAGTSQGTRKAPAKPASYEGYDFMAEDPAMPGSKPKDARILSQNSVQQIKQPAVLPANAVAEKPANAVPAKPNAANAAVVPPKPNAANAAAAAKPANAIAEKPTNAVATKPAAIVPAKTEAGPAKPANVKNVKPANAAPANAAPANVKPANAKPANAAPANAVPAKPNVTPPKNVPKAPAVPANTSPVRSSLFSPEIAAALVTEETETEEYPQQPEECTLPAIPKKRELGPIIPPLPAGKRPNIIVILTDDQGFDDHAMHHPLEGRLLDTPNFSRLMRMSKEFRNFYVTPMCSQTRAELLTGRDYPRTGTLLVSGGYDYINRGEQQIGQAMKQAGYKTSHFGKWHNGRTLGYEPWNVGFEDSWLPQAHIHMDNVMRHNGEYVPTKGLMEHRLMDRILEYLKKQESSDQPFFMYYASHAPHAGFMFPGVGPRWQRPSPPQFSQKYRAYGQLASDTAEVMAMTEYMDSVFGRLLDYLENSQLLKNTYILFTSDNGSELFPQERKPEKRPFRMPSKMVGFKRAVSEGGIRQTMMVAGPGIPAGSTDYTLTSVKDVMATSLHLAGASSKVPGNVDGVSFANLFGAKPQLTKQQEDRMLFHFKPDCVWPDLILPLDDDRNVIKSDPVLDYKKGGQDGSGWESCMAVRWGLYKWDGSTPSKVYKIVGNNHIEAPCNQFLGFNAPALANRARGAVQEWWKGLVAEKHSFQKPTFFLGWNGNTETNVIVDGAFDRPAGNVLIRTSGASGFKQVGDYIGFKVQVDEPGTYYIGIVYQSNQACTMKLSVGPYKDIMSEEAPSTLLRLPAQGAKDYLQVGRVQLKRTKAGTTDEIRLEVVRMAKPGQKIFNIIENIRFSLRDTKPERINVATPKESAFVPDVPKEGAFVPFKANQPDPELSGVFQNPLLAKQLAETPAGTKNPSFYDSCETEGVWHAAKTCGIPNEYFLD